MKLKRTHLHLHYNLGVCPKREFQCLVYNHCRHSALVKSHLNSFQTKPTWFNINIFWLTFNLKYPRRTNSQFECCMNKIWHSVCVCVFWNIYGSLFCDCDNESSYSHATGREKCQSCVVCTVWVWGVSLTTISSRKLHYFSLSGWEDGVIIHKSVFQCVRAPTSI